MDDRRGKRATIVISSDEEEEEEDYDDDSEEQFSDSDEPSESDNTDIDQNEEEDRDEASESDDCDVDDESLSEKVVSLLQGGKDIDSLKLNECKAYLRKPGLRLAGNRAVCIARIKEHWRLKHGSGYTLYPRSSFNINCTGDVCMGDVVLFRQKVYEKFSKVTRHGRVRGSRIVAGRVVKESYGAAKQQHTFTMTSAIAIEDVRREVKILRALNGHKNVVRFYEAYEDRDNVYIVMELCEGGELLDSIISRGGKYTEEDAKAILRQMLNAAAFCHLQGVVHRDLKPENFLFASKDENSELKAIDFGLSDFVKLDERLNDTVGSAYYVAPEVILKSYSTEADVWSIGVIAYILLCGCRPFYARTESGIFLSVLKSDISFDEPPWPSLSDEARDFVKRLLNKDLRKRMSAAQALSHPWIKNYDDAKVPLDILIFKLMKAYMRSSSLRKAALRALSKALTVDELIYLKEQFALLEPNKNGTINLENIKAAFMVNATDAMKESRIADILASLNALQYRRMDFDEFCAAALSVHQLEALDHWEKRARYAFDLFERDGNKAIVINELASELGLGPSIPVHAVLHDWIRHTDGKLSFLGFVKLLHGPSRSLAKAQ